MARVPLPHLLHLCIQQYSLQVTENIIIVLAVSSEQHTLI